MSSFQKLFLPVNNSPLIIFRIAFGFLLCFHVFISLVNGTVYSNFIEPPFTFNYIGFDFLQPLAGKGMYFYFAVMVLFALMIMLGAWYRLAMIGFASLWTIQYLMQKSDYNNHYYLVLLLCWIMVVMPANRYASIDVWRKAVKQKNYCPACCNFVFIAQTAIVYFFAAVSKINTDWFSGKFLSIQFSRLSTHHLTGWLYGQEWFPVFIAYAGFLFDLLIVPLLLWKPTRKPAFIIACLFHLFNSFSFGIGIFPFLSIALLVFFFKPDGISRIFFRNKTLFNNEKTPESHSQKTVIACILSIYLAIQILLPLRFLLFPGYVFWTEEGYRMSWKMMMRTKSGTVYFKIVDPASKKTWKEEPARIFSKKHMMWLAISPDINWQYAQRLKREYEKQGYPNVEVYAIGAVSLNRSSPKPLIDSTVNLAKTDWQPLKHSPWITEYRADKP